MKKFVFILLSCLMVFSFGSCDSSLLQRLSVSDLEYNGDQTDISRTTAGFSALISAINKKDEDAFLDCMSIYARRNAGDDVLREQIQNVFSLITEQITDYYYTGSTWHCQDYDGYHYLNVATGDVVVVSENSAYELYFDFYTRCDLYASGIGFKSIEVYDAVSSANQKAYYANNKSGEFSSTVNVSGSLTNGYGVTCITSLSSIYEGYDEARPMGGYILCFSKNDRTFTRAMLEENITEHTDFKSSFGEPNAQLVSNLYYELTDEPGFYIRVVLNVDGNSIFYIDVVNGVSEKPVKRLYSF